MPSIMPSFLSSFHILSCDARLLNLSDERLTVELAKLRREIAKKVEKSLGSSVGSGEAWGNSSFIGRIWSEKPRKWCFCQMIEDWGDTW